MGTSLGGRILSRGCIMPWSLLQSSTLFPLFLLFTEQSSPSPLPALIKPTTHDVYTSKSFQRTLITNISQDCNLLYPLHFYLQYLQKDLVKFIRFGLYAYCSCLTPMLFVSLFDQLKPFTCVLMRQLGKNNALGKHFRKQYLTQQN